MTRRKVTLLDGSTREYETWSEYINERNSLTLHSHNDKPAHVSYYDNGRVGMKNGLRKISVIEKVINLLRYFTIKMEVSIIKFGTKKAKRSQKKKLKPPSVGMVTIT